MRLLSVANSFLNEHLIARIGIVSLVNTLAGVLTFPILKTLFFAIPSGRLMAVSYIICLLISFYLHGKYSFRAQLTLVKLFLFIILNGVALISMIHIVLLVKSSTDIDVRVIQPFVAVAIQFTIILFYKLIFYGKR